jgi:rod shape-determining protein MreC
LRDGPFQDLKVPLTWTAAIALVVALVIGLTLLFGDRRGSIQAQAYDATKSASNTVAKPVGEVLSAPVRWVEGAVGYVGGYFFAVSENRQLKARIAELERIHDEEIALANENGRFRALLGLKTEPPIPMVGAKVITDARGPFANTRLADAGLEKGVAVGNPVMSERGLVGRVVGVAHGVSRVLLLTDIASRTPVLIDRTGARAILIGDGGANPKLSYMRGVDPVKAGDRVLTSGDGGVLPRGLPVGTAVLGLDGEWRIRLDSDNAPIDYVRILQFKDFSQLANQPALNEAAPPPLSPAEAADLQARLAAASTKPTPPASSSTPPAAAAVKPGMASPAKPAAASGAAAKPAHAKPAAAAPHAPAAHAQPQATRPPSDASEAAPSAATP